MNNSFQANFLGFSVSFVPSSELVRWFDEYAVSWSVFAADGEEVGFALCIDGSSQETIIADFAENAYVDEDRNELFSVWI